MNDNIKYRHELKYKCSIAQFENIKQRINNIMPLDKHISSGESYCIRSLYFDNYSNKCFYENENGTDPREKFRIRIYNADKNRISLECKRKERGKTYKTSCLITEEQFNMIINGGNSSDFLQYPQLLRKFMYLVKTQLYKPVVIVEYDRIPYVYKIGNVRVTLDTNIRSSSDVQNFFNPDLQTRPILPTGQHLLEVKYDELLPDHIKTVLQFDNLQQTTFSKYYLCRKFSTRGVL